MKIKFTFWITLFISYSFIQPLFAAAPGWSWVKSAGGPSDEIGQFTSTDAIGNVYVLGTFTSQTITFGSTVLTNADPSGSTDLFLTKYDASGNVIWAQQAGGNWYEYGKSICVDPSGNIYITGIYYSASATFGSTALSNVGGGDIFIVKYDSSGSVIRALSAGGNSDDRGNSICPDADGNVYLSGFFISNSIMFGTTNLTNAGDVDLYIAKYDSTGNVSWAVSAGGTNNDQVQSIVTDAGGNVFATGGFNSTSLTFGSTVLTSGGDNDIFIVKYDSSGNAVWANRTGGRFWDYGYALCNDPLGNIYLTGEFKSDSITFRNITLVNADTNYFDFFIVKLDSSGDASWAKRAGGVFDDYGRGICFNPAGRGSVCANGDFLSDSIKFGRTAYANTAGALADVFIASYDTAGNVLYAKTAGGSLHDNSTGIGSNSSGEIFLTGSFQSNTMAFDSTVLTNTTITGERDMFVGKLGISCVSTTSSITPTACFRYISPSGNYSWTLSGTYSDTIPNVSGCDSIIAINLTINTVDTSVTQGAITLASTATGATYQWLDCDAGFAAISGDTNQVFSATVNGNFAVALLQNGCVDTSACYNITGVGFNELNSDNFTAIYPNPSNGQFIISSSEFIDKLKIINALGQVVAINEYEPGLRSIVMDASAWGEGIYILQGNAGTSSFTLKMVIY